MDEHKRGLVIIHICVLLWGFTAILGALISVSSVPLVLWRVVFAGAILTGIALWKGWQPWPGWVWWRNILIGVLVGIHWVAFYSSIKMANASVGVVTISTASFFTAIFAPFINKGPFKWAEVLLGLLIIPAIVLIVGHVDLGMQKGFWVGIFAAALVGVFAPLINQLLVDYPKVKIIQASAVQMWTIGVLMVCVLPVFQHYFPGALVVPQLTLDWVYLFLLAAFCTVLPFTLSMYAQRFISPFTSTLILNLEPVYGVLLAIFILREDKELNLWFYLGVFMLFAVVFGHAVYLRRNKPRSAIDK